MIGCRIERADNNRYITTEYGDTMREAERKALATAKGLIRHQIGCDVNLRDCLGGLRYRVTENGKVEKTP